MVQDYRYLNEWTVKNSYPLSLITDIVENIGTRKVFIKINLHWEYNNMWIKKGDKWKVAFTTPEGSFEPTVMFFGLMNEILQNLINTGRVASFIDDIIIRTETEEGYDELVKEVVKRLVENNLYIKPKKYKCKMKKVGFLGVVIGLEGIKMEKEKMKGVLDWPTPKCCGNH